MAHLFPDESLDRGRPGEAARRRRGAGADRGAHLGLYGGEYAEFTPVWMRIALVLVTGPAMVAGAAVRVSAAGIHDL